MTGNFRRDSLPAPIAQCTSLTWFPKESSCTDIGGYLLRELERGQSYVFAGQIYSPSNYASQPANWTYAPSPNYLPPTSYIPPDQLPPRCCYCRFGREDLHPVLIRSHSCRVFGSTYLANGTRAVGECTDHAAHRFCRAAKQMHQPANYNYRPPQPPPQVVPGPFDYNPVIAAPPPASVYRVPPVIAGPVPQNPFPPLPTDSSEIINYFRFTPSNGVICCLGTLSIRKLLSVAKSLFSCQLIVSD